MNVDDLIQQIVRDVERERAIPGLLDREELGECFANVLILAIPR